VTSNHYEGLLRHIIVL